MFNINSPTVQQMLKDLPEGMGNMQFYNGNPPTITHEEYPISQEEFEFYKKNYQLHYFTVNIVSTVFARFFSGVDNVRSCTFDQFVKLLIVLIHKMKDLGIEYLPHFVLSSS